MWDSSAIDAARSEDPESVRSFSFLILIRTAAPPWDRSSPRGARECSLPAARGILRSLKPQRILVDPLAGHRTATASAFRKADLRGRGLCQRLPADLRQLRLELELSLVSLPAQKHRLDLPQEPREHQSRASSATLSTR